MALSKGRKAQIRNIIAAVLVVFLLGYKIYTDLNPTSPVLDIFSYTDDEVVL